MKICVKDAFTSENYEKEYTLTFEKERIADDFPDITDAGINASVVISSARGVVSCTMSVKADFTAVCGRCAKEFTLPLSFCSDRLVRKTDDGEFEDVIYVDGGYCFDVYDEIRTQINFEYPMKPLCREDCKGLCPVCGCDLNVRTCSCDVKTVDPRLAVFKNL